MEGKYRLPCGHNNGVIPGVWPSDTMICVDCKARTQFVYKIAQDKEVKKMSRKAYCKNCPDTELITDEEQELGYCVDCIDGGDFETPEPYDELRHPDDNGKEEL